MDYKDYTNGNEELTNTGADTQEYLKNINPNKRNSCVPPPPKPGEIMYCQMCRKPMMPEDFSSDIKKAKYEFKFQVHWACKIAVDEYLDRITPGLLSERKRYGIAGTALVQRGLRKNGR